MGARKENGVAISEAAASLVVLIPVIAFIILSGIAVARVCLIQAALADVAHTAARQLAINYWKDPTIATDRATQDNLVFNQIRVPCVVNSSSQFEEVIFDAQSSSPNVSLLVRYVGGRYGLPQLSIPPFTVSSNLSARAAQALE